MKITRIETFILGTGSAKDLLFCRVETEDGLYGWGEAYVTQGKEKVVAECIQSMAPHVIGRSAFNIRHTGQVMYEDFAISYVRAMREALGPDFELLIEAHRRFAPAHAIRIGHRLAEFGIDWYEEPCLSENIELVAEVRRALQIPIVTGEAIYTREAFFDCLARRAADILNPDICVIGGITAMLDIAAMAQPQAVVMAPHNYNSTLVGLAATVHVSAVIQNFRIAEYFVNFADLCRDIATESLGVQDGWVELPTSPGLGVDLDVEKLRAHPHQEATHRGFRQYWEEYPRKGYTPSLR